MTITEFISALQSIRAEHGDLQVARRDRDEDFMAAEPDVRETDKWDHGEFAIGEKVVVVD